MSWSDKKIQAERSAFAPPVKKEKNRASRLHSPAGKTHPSEFAEPRGALVFFLFLNKNEKSKDTSGLLASSVFACFVL